MIVQEIMDFFSENAEYSRQTQDQPFKGKQNVRGFFARDRHLVGKHDIKDHDIDVQDGVAPKLNFTPVKGRIYATVTVKGMFKGDNIILVPHPYEALGTLIDEEKTERDVVLDFVDYWVIDKDKAKAVYRHSDIKRTQGHSTDLRVNRY